MTVKFEFLADRPEALHLIAGWYFKEWGRLKPNSSAEGMTNKISQSMNTDKLPLILLAIDGEDVIGVVELKYREMDIYPDKEHWLGGLFVMPEHRGAGIGKQLAAKVIELSREMGIKKLYLQTENLDGGIYKELGWQCHGKIHSKGMDVLVMERSIEA